MYYGDLITLLISFLTNEEHYIWLGDERHMAHLMYEYNEHKVPAIKYLRDNMYKTEEFQLQVKEEAAAIVWRFGNSIPDKKKPLGLKEAKDLLDTIQSNSTY